MIFSNADSPTLKVREWFAIFILIIVVLGLAVTTSFSTKDSSLHEKYHQFAKTPKKGFEVVVNGAVDHSGVYRFYSPVSMKDLLTIVQATPDADLRKFQMEQVVSRGKVLNIPVRAMITIRMSGAVKEPGLIEVPKGSSVEDLLTIVALDDRADTKVLKKKRKLKADETIDVPWSKKSF